jgi:hypothetical protein
MIEGGDWSGLAYVPPRPTYRPTSDPPRPTSDPPQKTLDSPVLSMGNHSWYLSTYPSMPIYDEESIPAPISISSRHVVPTLIIVGKNSFLWWPVRPFYSRITTESNSPGFSKMDSSHLAIKRMIICLPTDHRLLCYQQTSKWPFLGFLLEKCKFLPESVVSCLKLTNIYPAL